MFKEVVYVLVVFRDSGFLPRQFPRVMSEKKTLNYSRRKFLFTQVLQWVPASLLAQPGKIYTAGGEPVKKWFDASEKKLSRNR